jgi:Eco57I restriction-modification methylase/MmeI, target recognition domain
VRREARALFGTMTDAETRWHEQWLGMVQPVEGLVVAVPALVEAQCMSRQPIEKQERLRELCPLVDGGPRSRRGKRAQHDGGDDKPERAPVERRAIADLEAFFDGLLGLTPDLFDRGDALGEELALYVPEGRQTIRPTAALRDRAAESGYVALVWDLTEAGGAVGLSLDRSETQTGAWDYPPAAKFDRLLRHARVPVGLLTNREVVRLVYAPHGESSGHIDFRVADMARVDGRPILDAFVMLCGATRWFAVAADKTLPALLAESRKRQANVTGALAEQVFDALQILLRGFAAAAERDGAALFDEAARQDGDHLYKGLLTVLLRLVFLLYAEDRGLLPVDAELYAEHFSVLGLYDQLQRDAGAHPDSMARRFGAWGRLIALFRAVYLGADHGAALCMPPRRGALFDPNRFPFLEGWGPDGAAPIVMDEHRAKVRVPTVDDETIYRVLEKLIVFESQRLSYRALDVEQIGSVYEALMGYHVVRAPGAAVCVKPDGVWVSGEEVLERKPAERVRFFKDTLGLSKAQAEKLGSAVAQTTTPEAVLEALGALSVAGRGGRGRDPSLSRARAGELVLQPGAERRRTSSHYTPRSLSAPIVRRTLEPLLAAMRDGGDAPSSERILELKICDPAMGSGAFLVEACRFLADQLVAAWTREDRLADVARAAPNEDPRLYALRLVAQRCLYGVDKNDAAVELAKLSLWLLTLARDLPFTFLDHALRHGDSLVGLDFDQIKSFHWKPGKQLELSRAVLDEALGEAIAIRQQVLDLAADPSPGADRQKRLLTSDANDALDKARLVADTIVGAFFAETRDKAREKERNRRLDLVKDWLSGAETAGAELRDLQRELRKKIPVFHWMLEFPEVFHAERPDPLDNARVNRAAYMDGFVGNPPFAGKNGISETGGENYLPWLQAIHEGAHGNADLSAHFFRRAAELIGKHGTIGLIATNTIAQGDTRASALQPLAARGFTIYDATRSMMWPGGAAVSVAVVHLAVGSPAARLGARHLDDAEVPAINSRLRGKPERADPVSLRSNAGCSFVGSYVLGMGFTLTPDERDALVAKDPKNAERIFPYLGGEEVNTSPTQSFDRYVISFGQMSLEEAERWPDLIAIVREKVKPERDRNKRDVRRQYWWRFGEVAPALFEAIRGAPRCLVTARVTKHLCFSFQPTDRILNEKLYVFPLRIYTAFAVTQSRVHGPWAWLFSSTMKNDLNYSASDCFETFPFPQPDPRAVIPALEDVGQRLYEARAAYMLATEQGLTQTYNALKDPACDDARIAELRRLHEEMDRAVLDAYGWTDVEVPAYRGADAAALERFEDEVIDRLFVLNAERAAEEKRAGVANGGKTKRAKKERGGAAQAALQFEDGEGVGK